MIDPLLPSAQLADDPILEPPALPSMCTGGLGARAKEKTEKIEKNQKTTALPIRLVGAVIIQAMRRVREKSKSGFRGSDCMSTHQRRRDTERVPT